MLIVANGIRFRFFGILLYGKRLTTATNLPRNESDKLTV